MIDRSDAVNLARNLVERDIDWDVAPPGVKCLADAVLAMDEYIRSHEAPREGWRDPKDKPPHLPGEHHSEDVLLCMKRARGWVDEQRFKIGHVSIGHWRPTGGNGNFDDDVQGWMPLPAAPGRSEEQDA